MGFTGGMKRTQAWLGRVSAAAVLLTLVLNTPTATAAVGTGPSFKGPVGLQLYSLRDEFKKEVPGNLDRVQKFGIKYVELAGTYGQTPEAFKVQLAVYGLVPIAAHYPLEKFRDDPESIAREAKAIGLKYAGVAWIPHTGNFTEKDAHETAALFNKAGQIMAKHGLKFFYHVHGYEFQPYEKGTLFDVLMTETDPKLVAFEMDILWVYFPGQDPVKLLQKYGKRWELVHLKDLKKGVEIGALTGATDVRNDVILGSGQIPLADILKAAKKAGVKYYFIEDESPSAVAQIPQSLKFLEQVKW